MGNPLGGLMACFVGVFAGLVGYFIVMSNQRMRRFCRRRWKTVVWAAGRAAAEMRRGAKVALWPARFCWTMVRFVLETVFFIIIVILILVRLRRIRYLLALSPKDFSSED